MAIIEGSNGHFLYVTQASDARLITETPSYVGDGSDNKDIGLGMAGTIHLTLRSVDQSLNMVELNYRVNRQSQTQPKQLVESGLKN